MTESGCPLWSLQGGPHFSQFLGEVAIIVGPLLDSPRRRNLFLKDPRTSQGALRFRSGGICGMPEHIHLLISEPDRGTPSTVMQVLKQRFVRRVLGDLRRRRNPSQASLWQEALDAGQCVAESVL